MYKIYSIKIHYLDPKPSNSSIFRYETHFPDFNETQFGDPDRHEALIFNENAKKTLNEFDNRRKANMKLIDKVNKLKLARNVVKTSQKLDQIEAESISKIP